MSGRRPDGHHSMMAIGTIAATWINRGRLRGERATYEYAVLPMFGH